MSNSANTKCELRINRRYKFSVHKTSIATNIFIHWIEKDCFTFFVPFADMWALLVSFYGEFIEIIKYEKKKILCEI